MSSKDYNLSQGYDHQFLFTKTTGTIARPSTAWIGGITATNIYASTGHSSAWTPDWINILHPSCSTPPCTALPADPLEPVTDSLLFQNLSESSANSLVTRLTDNNLVYSIGVLSNSGRLLTVRSLREANSLSKFNKATKLCRYSKDVSQLDLHRALMILGKTSTWPSGGECSDFTSSNSQSALRDDVKSVYFKVPSASAPASSNLKELTGTDFVEVSKGLRTIVPLSAYYKSGAMHIHNKTKFCQAWNREKKRRAVGNCIITNYNADPGTLSIGGVNHGLTVTKANRAPGLRTNDYNLCHPDPATVSPGYNCGYTETHYTNGYNAVVSALNATILSIATATARLGAVPGLLSTAQAGCMTPCPPCVYEEVCTEASFTCIQNICTLQPSVCTMQEVNCISNSLCNMACSQVVSLTAELASLPGRITQLENQKTRLETQKACVELHLASATRATCLAAMTANVVKSHKTSYSHAGLTTCGLNPLPIDFNQSAINSTCWSLEKLKPSYAVTGFNDGVSSNESGTIGILGDTQGVTSWDKDAVCNSGQSATQLYSIPAKCDDKYKDLINLPDNLCDDSIVDYDGQTCVIP